ncbi:MAG TPA: hypothetical protein VMU11_00100 [Verrucomicrobiae bacterium]|nr:hypothetical protein [Verrucomicrobiae bacterium]
MDRQPSEEQIKRANRVERIRVLHSLYEQCARQGSYAFRDKLEDVREGIRATLTQRARLLNAVMKEIHEDPEILRDSVVQSILRHFHIEPSLDF